MWRDYSRASRFKGVFGLLAFVLSALLSAELRAKILIAPVQVLPFAHNERVDIKAGRVVQIPVSLNAPGEIRVSVRLLNKFYDDLNVWICSDAGYESFLAARSNDCRGVRRGKGVITTSLAVHRPGRYRVVLDNGFSALLTKKSLVTVNAAIKLSPGVRQGLRSSFEQPFRKIQTYFKVPEFNFTLAPCGQRNAMSRRGSGDIVFCSELFFYLLRRSLKGAAEAILWHELGHSLLDLMGLPNSDNEEVADEFALVMLLWQGRQEQAIDWIRYYRERDSAAEARHMLRVGDRHPLSVQRIRNIEAVLDRPKEIVSDWNNQLYPKLSDKALQEIIDNPGRFHERDKARKELESR